MGTVEAAGGIPFEAIRPGGRWVAPLPLHHCSHCPPVWDADKLTYGQQLSVFTPHAVEGLLKQLPGKWIFSAHLTHYQALLLDAPRVRCQTPCFLNPATLLPNPERDHPLHDCSEILAEAWWLKKT